jgi:ABC-type polysaccharide/polyol phosphate export permease
MAHLVDAFRAAVLGTHAPDLVGLGVLAALGVFTLLIAQRLFSVFDGVLADVI